MTKKYYTFFFIFSILSQILIAQDEVNEIITNESTPIANIDYDTSDINGTVNVAAPGVLINDSDADINDLITVTNFTVNGTEYAAGDTANFTQGAISINEDGSYIFTPITGFTGTVSSISYTISDGTNFASSSLEFTVEEITNLLAIISHRSCNQGYTADGVYRIRYDLTIENTSNARDYHESSLITNLDIINDLNAIYGDGCATIDDISISTDTPQDFVGIPYPQEFNDDAINLDFEEGNSSSVFNTNAINNLTLYPRQTMDIIYCVSVDPFCDGRPNPTPTNAGVDFNNIVEINSSTDTTSSSLMLTNFHTTEAVVSASLFVPETAPEENTDGTFSFENFVIITNEGNTTATNVNFNMGLESFINNNIVFVPDELIVTQESGTTVTTNNLYDGENNSQLLAANTSLAPGATIVLKIAALIEPISNTNSSFFSQLQLSQTQGPADGLDETSNAIRERFSFVTWSDSLGNHLDRYYIVSDTSEPSTSNSQCNCGAIAMSFDFNSRTATSKMIIANNTVTAPNGILEHEEITFQITIENSSDVVQIADLQLQDNLNTICNGNIISLINAPFISNSTASVNPNLNTSFDGINDINIFDGSSGLLEANETITIQFTVLFNEDCIGENQAIFSGIDPLGNSPNSSSAVVVNAFTDTDNDGISNVNDIDDDNDTILDIDEYNGLNPLADADNDLTPNYRDIDFGTDNNNDGIVDMFDFDNDGVPNHFDLDSDGDGILDITEVDNTTINNTNGIADITFVGQNGLHNDVEINDTFATAINYTIADTDGTGNANFIDIDSDGDGIVDTIEAQTTDDYTVLNFIVSATGIDTAFLTGISPIDTDEDGITDYTDTNSDNDTRLDSIEGWDIDSDGTAETIASNTDSDGDGLDDAYDNDDATINPTNGQTPTDFPNIDNTDNPERDWREILAVVVIVENVSITEGGNLVFEIALVTKNNNAIPVQSASPITIDFSTADGDNTDDSNPFEIAIAPFDYNQISLETITIPAFDETAQFIVTSLDDTIHEQDEFLSLTGTITSNNTITLEVSALGTIIDNEPLPEISMNNAEAEEGNNLEYEILLDRPSSTPVTISIQTFDDTAIAPGDYEETTTSITIEGTFDPSNANTSAAFIIPSLTDNTNEPDQEVLNVTGTIITNNIGNTDLDKTGTIIDIDPNPLVSIEDVTAVEGNSLTFTFSLLNPDTEEPIFNYSDINLDIQTSSGTATLADYNELSGPITILANTASITATASTINDRLNEDSETFSLETIINSINVSNLSSELINTGTIKDDDIPNLFSPNGDGDSDVFMIAGMEDFPNFTLVIFDRWGSEIYNYSNDGRINPIWWNGSYNGNPAPKGVYFYNLNFNDGTTKSKKNFIELIR